LGFKIRFRFFVFGLNALVKGQEFGAPVAVAAQGEKVEGFVRARAWRSSAWSKLPKK